MKEIDQWKSVRRYQQKQIESEKVREILEAARRAPSWQNLQPWHFLVIESAEGKEKLAEICATGKIVKYSPVCIALFGDTSGFDKNKSIKSVHDLMENKMTQDQVADYLDNPLASPEHGRDNIILARLLEQVSYAASFMILKAKQLGIGSCVLGGVENSLTTISDKYDEVRQFFNIPEKFEMLALVTLGYSDENEKLRSRKDLDDVVSYEKVNS